MSDSFLQTFDDELLVSNRDTPTTTVRPKVSVLMGVYNGLPHLERAIESILHQTFKEWEFVIIDDASQDGSAEVIQRYARDDRRIVCWRNTANVGLGAVLRAGVEHARGDFVARMDADDVSVPERLTRQVEYMLQHPETDIVGSYALDVTDAGAPLRERRVPASHKKIVRVIWSCPLIHPTVMFRRDAILRVGSYSSALRRRQDYDLWFRCVKAGLRFANIPEPLLHYTYSAETLKRNDLRSAWRQVRMGLEGCRAIKASPLAYAMTSWPLLEAMMPDALRMRFASLKRKIDPRAD